MCLKQVHWNRLPGCYQTSRRMEIIREFMESETVSSVYTIWTRLWWKGWLLADGYDMGYQSVLEISGALKNQLYTHEKPVRRIIGCCIRKIFSGKRYSSFFIRMINHISKLCDNPTICEYWAGLWECVARSNP